MLDHEYALLGGVNRAKIGRYLATLAATVSAVLVFLLLTLVDIASWLGWPFTLPPVAFSLIGAGAIYALLYAMFDDYVWKWSRISKLLRVPDLSGRWRCDGQSINSDGSLGVTWQGEVIVVQSWDRIRVRLKTATSASNSIAAALTYDAADGYRLLYNYQNEPKVTEPELRPHRGFADLLFTHDCASAEGNYFNGAGRYTYGTMTLKKEPN